MISGLAKMDEDNQQDSELAMGQFEARWRIETLRNEALLRHVATSLGSTSKDVHFL